MDQLSVSSDIKENILSTYKQSNNEVEDINVHYAKKSITQITDDYVAGFRNGEANIEQLNQPLYEKYFTVPKMIDDQENFQKLQNQRMVVLYCIYQIKQRQSSKTSMPFQKYVAEYIKEHSSEDDMECQQSIIKNLNFDFIIGMLQELKSVNNGDLLQNALNHFYLTLKKHRSGALFANHVNSFELESTFNRFRDFLIQIIKESSSKTLVHTTFKCFIVLGHARGSVEDFLQLSTIYDEQVKKGNYINLVEELQLLDADSQNKKEAEKSFDCGERIESNKPIYLTYNQKRLGTNKSYAIDESFLYVLNEE